VILANFSVAAQNIIPDFPYTGTWYNLMDNSTINVSNTASTINLQPGEYRVYGNRPPNTLSNPDLEITENAFLIPNPTRNYFSVSVATQKVEVYSITGQLVKSFQNTFESDYLFDVSDLDNGIYLVKMSDEFNRVQTLKLVKN